MTVNVSGPAQHRCHQSGPVQTLCLLLLGPTPGQDQVAELLPLWAVVRELRKNSFRNYSSVELLFLTALEGSISNCCDCGFQSHPGQRHRLVELHEVTGENPVSSQFRTGAFMRTLEEEEEEAAV